MKEVRSGGRAKEVWKGLQELTRGEAAKSFGNVDEDATTGRRKQPISGLQAASS